MELSFQLLHPCIERHLSFAKAPVHEWTLLELHPCSVAKPFKAPSPLVQLQLMPFLVAAPPGSRATSQYLLGTHQLSSMSQLESKSSIPPSRNTTISVRATHPSCPLVGQTTPLPGNPACDYAKWAAADSRFQSKGYEAQAVERK